MGDIQVAFFDLETTGLNPRQDRIIEVGICDADGSSKIDFLLDPQIEITNSDIHGITLDTVEENNAVPFRRGIKGIEKEISSNFGDNVIFVAHNNWMFDQLFLEQEYIRNARRMPEGWLFADTLKIARKIDIPTRKSLSHMYRYYMGRNMKKEHRALPDAMALSELYPFLTQQYEAQRGTFEITDWARNTTNEYYERITEVIRRSRNVSKLNSSNLSGKPDDFAYDTEINNGSKKNIDFQILQKQRRVREDYDKEQGSLQVFLDFEANKRNWTDMNVQLNKWMNENRRSGPMDSFLL